MIKVTRYPGAFKVEDAPTDTATMTARQLAAAYLISERTARRHLARGTVPDRRRVVGRDGKTYPGTYRPPSPARAVVKPDLVMARNAIRRGQAPSPTRTSAHWKPSPRKQPCCAWRGG